MRLTPAPTGYSAAVRNGEGSRTRAENLFVLRLET